MQLYYTVLLSIAVRPVVCFGFGEIALAVSKVSCKHRVKLVSAKQASLHGYLVRLVSI
jgi:hypothetical protein